MLVISNHNSFRVLFDKNCFRIYYLKDILIFLALEMACPGNRHCANCIGTLLFPVRPSISTKNAAVHIGVALAIFCSDLDL